MSTVRPGASGVEAAAPTALLASPAIRASLWTMGGYGLGQLIRLCGNLILTRLLIPEVFGEITLVFVFVQGLAMFSDVGTRPAIVQSPRGDDARFLNTAFTIQAARGVTLWIASCAIAWPLAAFYGRPAFRWLIPAVGLTALLQGLESTAILSAHRHLRRERITVLELVTQVINIAVTVLLARLHASIHGAGDPGAVWAIVGGSLFSGVVRVVLSHAWLPGIRNRFSLDRESARQLLVFGRWIFVSTLLTFLAGQADRLILGKLIPLAMFGVYSIAASLAQLPTQALSRLGSAVVFPAYSRRVDRPDFKDVFWRVRSAVLLGGGAIVSALLATGPLLIAVLYDRRYADAGWMLQLLSAAAWFQVLESGNGAALLARGETLWVASGSAAKVAGMVALVPLGFWAGGFPGALCGLVGADLLRYLVSALGAARAGLRGLGVDVALTVAAGAVSALGMAAGRLAERQGAGSFVALVAAAAAACAPWGLAALWALRRARAGAGAPHSTRADSSSKVPSAAPTISP